MGPIHLHVKVTMDVSGVVLMHNRSKGVYKALIFFKNLNSNLFALDFHLDGKFKAFFQIHK